MLKNGLFTIVGFLALQLLGCTHQSNQINSERLVSSSIVAEEIIDLKTGKTMTPSQLISLLADAKRVIVGEDHTNQRHHQIELFLLEKLPIQRPQGSLLLEMIDRDQQSRVNELKVWLHRDPIVRDTRIKELLSWNDGWPWASYGQIVMKALYAPYPLLAANLGRAQVEILKKAPSLPEGQDSVAPAVLQEQRNIIRHMHDGKIDNTRLNAMLSVQQHRDRFMAQQLFNAPTPALLLSGNLHAAKTLGVPLHYGEIMNAKETPLVLYLAEKGMYIDASVADFVWYTEPARGKRG